jgi:hypothetical protein
LYLHFIILIYRTYKNNITFLPYLLSVLFLFTGDSQGFTPNNLIIFLIYCLTIRAAIYKKNNNESNFIL